MSSSPVPSQLLSWFLAASLLGLAFNAPAARPVPAGPLSTQVNIVGPGFGRFGAQVVALPNGNIIITAPHYDGANSYNRAEGYDSAKGAVYLYNGRTHALISRLVGEQEGDDVGCCGIMVLPNGNYLLLSPHWPGGSGVGAVTWGSGTTGVTGTISAANSLVGSAGGDQVGGGGIGVLPDGNYVVSSPHWSKAGAWHAGAVTWCNGATGCTGVVSTTNSLVGSATGDQVGYGADGITVLPNGNYVVSSPYWANGGAGQAGAVTWGNGTTGVTGTVSAANSLVGSAPGDLVGGTDAGSMGYITVLPNSNYVVHSPYWANSGASQAGAVTWGNGTRGVTGTVSSANSLVGSAAGDQVGVNGIMVLSNGNYVVSSFGWANGVASQAGAATWCSGTVACTGVVSSTNSLVGSAAGDQVGWGTGNMGYITALPNGNYVVRSVFWANGGFSQAGAATWCSGTAGCTGVVSSTNSLVGSTGGDLVGWSGITALPNGNYVVGSPDWTNGEASLAGAATWCSGTVGCSGVVSSTNSLVGSATGNWVGGNGITALTNGNYVVRSPFWANAGASLAGAATWCSGTVGCTGVVSSTNSLVGAGSGYITVLPNGNYLVLGPGGASQAGGVTWGNGTTGITGTVSAANSLVGSAAGDQVGIGGTALTTGNYVVNSFDWANGGASLAGAVTWGNGATGVTGTVSAANSLVGSAANDRVGSGWLGITALPDGNYVVNSPDWANGGASQAGAVTWGNGATGVAGTVSAANSLVGSAAGDYVGGSLEGSGCCAGYVTVLTNGNFVVRSFDWANGGASKAGAVTLGDDLMGTAGVLSTTNSVLGGITGGGAQLSWSYDYANDQLVVGRPMENIVTFFPAPGIHLYGAGQLIANGTATVSAGDGTDFGTVLLGQALTHTFTISNTSQGALNLTGSPQVKISGAAAADFSVVLAPGTPILSNTATTFQVRFRPTVAAARVVTVTVLSNDADASPYRFTLLGLGEEAPVVLPFRVFLPFQER